ncbi:T9SS type A sorting domain-containing protein [bacterium]|nr:T9SS type A sorting domain-containing protein [bacterium]
MKLFLKFLAITAILIVFILLFPIRVNSQNYWSTEEIRYFLDRYGETRNPLRDSKEYIPSKRFSYPYEFYQLTQFYADWQLVDPDSADNGGIIEAESGELRDVIQTDNTQEVIWAWCYFYQFTGETTHIDNTELAWDYVMRFPAYEEEHSTSSYYYPVWNCGLGLLAEMKYREVFGLTTFSEYADSCALHIIDNPLSFTPAEATYRVLHPMVTGFLAGALYKYGCDVDNEGYKTAAVNEAIRVKEWIEDYPSLHLNWTVWAMSSGTAMWGVLNSYFMEYPEEAPEWIEDYARYLPPMVEPEGEYDPYLWDNSWNIWYANCYRSIIHFVPDTLYYNRFRRIFEYLLAQDTDNDGGIPASYDHPPTEDMTWISAYISLMGLETIIDSLPNYDAGLVALDVEYEPPLTYIDTTDLNFTVANFGVNPIEDVHFILYADWGIALDTTIDLVLGEVYEPSPLIPWVPGSEAPHRIEGHTYCTLDESDWNDTLSMQIEVTPMRILQGYTHDDLGEGIEAKLRFWLYQGEISTLYDSTISESSSGFYEISLPALSYKIEILPEFPYFNAFEDSVRVDPDTDTTIFESILYPADLLLVDDDGGDDYESYFINALNDIDITYYYWERETKGVFQAHRIHELNTPVIIWFTGNCSTNTLTTEDRDSLAYILDLDGKLLLTGKDIGDDIGSTEFYSDYLKASYEGNTTTAIVYNVDGDLISGHLRSIMLGGSGSAGNQDSPDIITPLDSASPILRYATDTSNAAGTRYTSTASESKLVYLGFGMEGMADAGTFTNREELLAAILHWFDPVFSIPVNNTILPAKFSLNVYPNPFNSAISIELSGIKKLHAEYPQIEIYDIKGRLVSGDRQGCTNDRQGGLSIHDRETSIYMWRPGEEIGSGIYLIKANIGKETLCKKVIYLK